MNIIPNSPFSVLFVDPKTNKNIKEDSTIDMTMFHSEYIERDPLYLKGEWKNIRY